MNDLVDRYGSPLYIYRLADVSAAAMQLRGQLPEQARLYYSVKANPHPVVIAELVRQGLHCEVSSAAELTAALSAGQAPERCLMTGPGKSAEELGDAVRRGVRTFSVESRIDLDRLERVASQHAVGLDVLLRLNGVQAASNVTGLRMTGAATQFGMSPETAVDILRTTGDSTSLNLVGVHIFPATNIADPDGLIAEFQLSITTAAEVLREAGKSGRLIDIGGGFAAPYARVGSRPAYPDLRRALEAALDQSLPEWRSGRPEIAFESGRYLVGGCGTLLTSVLDVKPHPGIIYVVLDVGVNALGGMSGLGRILTPDAQPIGPAAVETRADRLSLVGPLCTPLDILSRSANIPIPDVGDVLEIPNVGAYGLTASLLGFLSRPVPAEVVLDGAGDVLDARRIVLVGESL
ncbi:type III PLP-dependent enzyme [Nonomuraea sp. NPDC050328]|uniref:type III PLP-dependent enzyme n=1 Tax=Nonomuraea sp. NPDC050328 TaxID=3364361 RepID=UPI0037B59229